MSYKTDCPHCGWVVRSPVKLHAPVMECPACGATFEATFIECEDNTTTSLEEPTPKDIRRIAIPTLTLPRISRILWIYISVAVMLIGGVGIYAKYYFDSQQAKATEYSELFKLTLAGIAVTADNSTEVCQQHLEKWQNAIGSKYTSIDSAISESLELQSERIDGIHKAKRVYEAAMKQLNSPPPEYAEAHKKLVSIYGTAASYFDLAISPSGNIGSYGQAVKSARDSLSKQFSELAVTLPK